MRHLIALAAVLTAIPVVPGQEKKKAAEASLPPIKVVQLDRKEPVRYDKDIEPILENKCMFCHSGAVKEAKFDMSSYDTLMKGGKRGAAIMPGKPDESLLIKLAARTGKPGMPPKDEEPLTPEELALMKLWVAQGAKGTITATVAKPTRKLGKLPEPVTPIVALAISPNQSVLAAGRGSQIHIYEPATGKFVRSLVNPDLKDDSGTALNAAHLDIVQSLAFSPDGTLLASGGFQEVLLWDVQTGLLRQQLTGFSDRVVSLDFSSDGKLATGGGAPSQEGEVRLFEIVRGNLLLEIKNGHSDTVFGVRFSPDGKRLASCGADKFVKVFEVASGKFLKSFEGHTHHVMDVGWKPDGKVLASGGADNVIKIWDYEKGEQIRTVQGHGKQITRLVFIGTTPNFATASGDTTVRFWNVNNGGNIRNFSGNNDFLYAVSVSSDGKLVAAGGQEGVVRLYNGANGQVLKTLQAPSSEANVPAK